MKKAETTSTFDQGLVMDLNPIVTPNNVVCNALNATLITMNGNENALQNDMGNGRVETAYLPEGYVPLGTAELGGIIYIVSYNPLTDRCQIGSFPSPERNIISNEFENLNKILEISDFYSGNTIKSPYIKLILLDKELNPGDKFQIICPSLKDYSQYISGYGQQTEFNADLLPRYLKLNVVSISDQGKITNLNNSLVWQPVTNGYYYIKQNDIDDTQSSIDLDEYRNLVSSNYSVFNSKTSGKLGILAQLECISSFDVSWDAKRDGTLWKIYLYLNWTYDNEFSKDKINLYGVNYTVTMEDTYNGNIIIDNYPKSIKDISNDIMDNNVQSNIVSDNYSVNYYTPYFVNSIDQAPSYSTNGGITDLRRNDGTDNQFLLYTPIEIDDNNWKEDNSVINLSIAPMMPFGTLEWMKRDFSIDLAKLGSGEISLREYRYFLDKSILSLSYALEAYPEKNKNINSITFNFHRIDSKIYDWIVKNQDYIDTDRIIRNSVGDSNGIWEINTQPSSILDIPDYSLIINNKSSYSGHDTQEINIENLEYGSVYLVEIQIDYNNEKIISYYRILYVDTIFNDYYYSQSDFANLCLEDVIADQNVINTNVSTQQQNIIQENLIYQEDADWNENNKQIISSIPQYQNVEQLNYSNYSYQINYQSIVKGQITQQTTYPNSITINSSIQQINIDNTSYIYETDGVLNQFTNTGVYSTQNSLNKPITQNGILSNMSISGNTFTSLFNNSINIPMQLLYNHQSNREVLYELKNLQIGNTFILFTGSENSSWIYNVDSYEASRTDSNSIQYGDDRYTVNTFDQFQTIYNLIKNKFDSNPDGGKYDIIAILSRTRQDAEEGRQGRLTCWGKGTREGDGDESEWSSWLAYGANNKTTDAILVYYAILDTSDNIILFAFGSPVRYAQWGNCNIADPIVTKKWESNIPVAVETQDILENGEFINIDKIAGPFSSYVKPFPLANTYNTVYEWSIFNYYDIYRWRVIIPLVVNSTISININQNIALAENLQVKNLKYHSNNNSNLQVEINGSVNMDDIISNITNIDSSATYIKDLQGNYIQMEISPNNVYIPVGTIYEPVQYIKTSYAGSGPGISMNNSDIQIQVADGYMQVVQDRTSQDNKIVAHFRQQEQALAITGIDLVI